MSTPVVWIRGVSESPRPHTKPQESIDPSFSQKSGDHSDIIIRQRRADENVPSKARQGRCVHHMRCLDGIRQGACSRVADLVTTQAQLCQRGVCLVILETMVTTGGADIHTASTHVSLNGSNVVQYHTPGQTCDNDDNLQNTLPCKHMKCRVTHLFYSTSDEKQITACSFARCYNARRVVFPVDMHCHPGRHVTSSRIHSMFVSCSSCAAMTRNT